MSGETVGWSTNTMVIDVYFFGRTDARMTPMVSPTAIVTASTHQYFLPTRFTSERGNSPFRIITASLFPDVPFRLVADYSGSFRGLRALLNAWARCKPGASLRPLAVV